MRDSLYLDLHVLQTVPPANLNRDDNGDPKEAYFGGVRRSRVSSQAWKRATRKRFADRVPEQDLATRTKGIAAELSGKVEKRTGLDQEQAARLSNAVLRPLQISPGKKAGETAYLLFYGHRQLDSIVELFADSANELAELSDEKLGEEVKELPVRETLQRGHPMDVALFGRMVADIPALNVDAATQVAHALSTHAVDLETDYYTAVDDNNERDETGAGMIGDIGFNSATLYRFASVGIHQLRANLSEPEAVRQAVDLFVDSFALAMPPGYRNSFAPRTRPHLVAAVLRDDQPVNLVSAFEEPVGTEGIAARSAKRLAHEHGRSSRQWGDSPRYTGICHTFDDESVATDSLAENFGPNRTFAELRDEIQAGLSASGNQV